MIRKGKVGESRAGRNAQIYLVGSSDETAGNQGCQWDGERLLIKLPEALKGERVRLEGVKFAYGEEFLATREGKPLIWNVKREYE